ncbi:bifunctional epoxide hydrolase 2-like protein [Tanacetum coccineum]|uniref:Bifunctional epoxide hydrolase 2-like protein n=1 Tax=Tanacetum coccineum TaxID=301880 RepID=A0ABQ5G0Y8_9ASTR
MTLKNSQNICTVLAFRVINKVFVVAKDFGAMVADRFALFYLEKIAGIITLGVPFMRPNAPINHQPLPEGHSLKVEAPALFIMGEKDYVFKFPGMDEYLKNGEVKNYVPNLEIIY